MLRPKSLQQRLFMFFIAFLILVGVIGSSKRRTLIASKTALAMTAPMGVMAGSPHPCGGMAGFSTNTVSILGSHENRDNS
ncbi:MAG: hypothetical protein PVI42_24220 [Desulfobacterales bacterium]